MPGSSSPNFPLRPALLVLALTFSASSIIGCQRVKLVNGERWHQQRLPSQELAESESQLGENPAEAIDGISLKGAELLQSIDLLAEASTAAPTDPAMDDPDWEWIEKTLQELEDESNAAYREVPIP